MQQHITIKGGVEVDNAIVGKAKVDGVLDVVLIVVLYPSIRSIMARKF